MISTITKKQDEKIDFKIASEIPEYCSKLAELLENQPLFSGQGNIGRKSKVISLPTFQDARIFGIFTTNATQILGNERGWHASAFGKGGYILWDLEGKRIPQGIELFLYDHYASCTLIELKETYIQVFEKLKTGWESERIEGDLFSKIDSEEFDLFSKNKTMKDEAHLIRVIAKKFGLHEDVNCHFEWEMQSECTNEKVYLWIRKSERKRVVGKFGFQLDGAIH